ncbi:hypothetical protein [Escherichia coli]|uniref:hypothetical protein n=1 Tax=Escherichia coli TaxID=562 RepID=UPI003D8189B2
MNNNKGSSQGVTQKGNICKKEAKVTDQFYNMITPALEETKRVLNIRAKIWKHGHQQIRKILKIYLDYQVMLL